MLVLVLLSVLVSHSLALSLSGCELCRIILSDRLGHSSPCSFLPNILCSWQTTLGLLTLSVNINIGGPDSQWLPLTNVHNKELLAMKYDISS